MTIDELRADCEARGVPYRMVEGRIQVLDATQLPGAIAALLRQDGYLRGHGPEAPAEAAAPAPPAPGARKA